MRKVYTLLVALIVSLLSFTAAAGTVTVTVNVTGDGSQLIGQFSDSNWNTVNQVLHTGVNTLELFDHYDNGSPTFYLNLVDPANYYISSLKVNGEESSYIGSSNYVSFYGLTNPTIDVTVLDFASVRTSTMTIEITDADLAYVSIGGTYNNNDVVLQNGVNTIKFAPGDTPVTVRHYQGAYSYEVPQVKYNGDVVPHTMYSGNVINNPKNGDYIYINSTDPNVQKYNVTFANGCNFDAISSVTVNGVEKSGWRNGISALEYASVNINFDADHYEISNLKDNNDGQTIYGSQYGFTLYNDHVISFDATLLAVNTVNFTVNNPEGIIMKEDNEYGETMSVTSSFSDTFVTDTKSYYIKPVDGWVFDSVIKTLNDNTTAKVTIPAYGGTVTLIDGESLAISVSNPAAARTATLTVNLNNTEEYKGFVYISNSFYGKTALVPGTNSFSFNPNIDEEKNFTVSASKDFPLYRVTYNGNSVTRRAVGEEYKYEIAGVDNGIVNITACDPSIVVPHDPATISFTSDSMLDAIASVSVDGVDVKDWQNGFSALTNNHYILFNFVEGWDDIEFTVNGENQTLSKYTKNQKTDPVQYKPFSYEVTSTSISIKIKGTAPVVVVPERTVSFTANIPAGVVITDVSDNANPQAVSVSSDSFKHTFYTLYPYITISAATGYTLEKVVHEPALYDTDGKWTEVWNSPITYEGEDRIIENSLSLSVGDNDKVAITVAAPNLPSFTVNVDGNVAKVLMTDANSNAIALTGESTTVYMQSTPMTVTVAAATGFSPIYKVKKNNVEIPGTDGQFTFSVTGNDVIDIITDAPTFTVNISGDISKISSLEDDDEVEYTLSLGSNYITWVEGSDYYLNVTDELYSVTLKSGADVKYKSKKGLYEFTPAVGDVLTVITDEPQAETFTISITGDLSKVTRIINGTTYSEYSYQLGDNVYEYDPSANEIYIMCRDVYSIIADGVTLTEADDTTYGYPITVHSGSIITIVTENPNAPKFTVNVTGELSAFNFGPANSSAISLQQGANTISMNSSPASYDIYPVSPYTSLFSVKVNDTPVSLTETPWGRSYYNFSVSEGDVVYIVTDDPDYVPPTFTINFDGDPSDKRIYMSDQIYYSQVDLKVGTQTITMPCSPAYYNVTAYGGKFRTFKVNGVSQTFNDYGYSNMGSYSVEISDGDVVEIVTDGNPYFTFNLIGDPSKVYQFMDESRRNITLQEGINEIEVANATSSYQYLLSTSSAVNYFKKNGETLSGTSQWMFSAKAGDEFELDTELPIVNANISWRFVGFEGACPITSITIDGVTHSSLDEDFATYMSTFVVPTGTRIAYTINTSDFFIDAVSHNQDSQLTGAYHYFDVVGDTQITIDGRAKGVYSYTITSNDPQHTLVYIGDTYSEPITLTEEVTTLEIDERTSVDRIYIKSAEDYVITSVLYEGNPVSLEDGYYMIMPGANSSVVVTINEIPRPLHATLYIDDMNNYDYIALNRARGTVFNSGVNASAIQTGYNHFNFNTDDVSTSGFTFYSTVKEGYSEVKVYINDVLQTGVDVTGRLEGIMLKDGDVIKVYCGVPETRTYNIQLQDIAADKVTITVDYLHAVDPFSAPAAAPGVMKAAPSITATGSGTVLDGTHMTVTVDESISEPYVRIIDEENRTYEDHIFTGSYTFPITGNHTIKVAADFSTTSIPEMTVYGSEKVDVYNLQGVLLMRNATPAQIKTLTPGLYIAGGRKVVVK